MDSLAEYFGAAVDRYRLLIFEAITWYDTDLPDITLESGPALAFNNTCRTHDRRQILHVKSCQAVFFGVWRAEQAFDRQRLTSR
jgi:hypothetical protein